MSCWKGHLDVVKRLMELTAANINYKCEWTSLVACYRDHLDIVKYLVETCHADVHLSDIEDCTSLTMACRCGSMSVSMYLL